MGDVSYGTPSVYDAESLMTFFSFIRNEHPQLHIYPENDLSCVYSLEKYIHRMNQAETSHIVVAKEHHNIIGCVTVEGLRLNEFRDVGELGISVLKGHRDKGVGRGLMAEMLAWARGNSRIHRIILHVNNDNDRAVHLYKKMGFRIEGCTDTHQDRHIVMDRMLCMGIEV